MLFYVRRLERTKDRYMTAVYLYVGTYYRAVTTLDIGWSGAINALHAVS